MVENACPLVVLYGYRAGRNELVFMGRQGLITLSGSRTKIEGLLRLCNGMTSVREIMEQMPQMRPKEVQELLLLCESQGIVRDSRELYLGFHQDSSNPQNFSRDLLEADLKRLGSAPRLRERTGIVQNALPHPSPSGFLNTLSTRHTTRRFSAGQMSAIMLSGLLKAIYGVSQDGNWSVPSGGALHPLDVYLVIPGHEQVLASGVYRWSPEAGQLTFMAGDDPSLWIRKAFNANSLLDHAVGIICLAADLGRTAGKYANRGYRLACLEAGHAAQNAYVFCEEQKLGVVEYGGFQDETLSSRLGLEFPHEAVLTTLIFGAPGGPDGGMSDLDMMRTADRLRQSLVGQGNPLTEVSLMEFSVGDYVMPEWAAVTVHRTPRGRMNMARNRAFGTGATTHEAAVKVLAEGYERYALASRRSERYESADNLGEPYLDPRRAVPYAELQHKTLHGLEPFDPSKSIDWVKGVRRQSGESIWVPSDLVYYVNRRSRQKPCYSASSNGVAAHFREQVAVETALYELIERDAFCVTWYAKRAVKAIAHDHLKQDMQQRISRWEQLGYRVTVLNLTLDGPPVVLVLIWARGKVPALCSGASCRPVFMEAAERAFSEAEFMAMSWHHRRPRRGMKAEDIESPADHGLYYLDPKNLEKAEWLLEPGECTSLPQDFNGSLPDYGAVVVDITPQEQSCGLKVIRVLSERLMPMNFGYGTEHYGHPRMNALDFRWSMEYPSFPHFFA
jgi:ribosomal protein S12 methylthiotransferase accessory factor